MRERERERERDREREECSTYKSVLGFLLGFLSLMGKQNLLTTHTHTHTHTHIYIYI